jgi:hypothetical protein
MPAGSGGHGGGHDGHGGGHDGHGAADAGTGGVGELEVNLTLPRAGLYKMFFQFQRRDVVYTAPFVLKSVAM